MLLFLRHLFMMRVCVCVCVCVVRLHCPAPLSMFNMEKRYRNKIIIIIIITVVPGTNPVFCHGIFQEGPMAHSGGIMGAGLAKGRMPWFSRDIKVRTVQAVCVIMISLCCAGIG